MKGYIVDIEKATKDNKNFRKVLYTAKNSQLVLMSLTPGEDIGEEVHYLDQFIRIEAGTGKAILDNVEHMIEDDYAIVIPAGASTASILRLNTGKACFIEQKPMPWPITKNLTAKQLSSLSAPGSKKV